MCSFVPSLRIGSAFDRRLKSGAIEVRSLSERVLAPSDRCRSEVEGVATAGSFKFSVDAPKGSIMDVDVEDMDG